MANEDKKDFKGLSLMKNISWCLSTAALELMRK